MNFMIEDKSTRSFLFPKDSIWKKKADILDRMNENYKIFIDFKD